jgi:hypothetical protein
MEPVVSGLGMAPFTTKYLHYGYRRVAYHWIRLDELIIKMCLVWLLTPYGTIGTTETVWYQWRKLYGSSGFRLRVGAVHYEVSTPRIPSSSISIDSPWWADYKNVFSLTIDTLWYHRYHGNCMVPVALGLGLAPVIVKYLHHGYRRVAYQKIRLVELIVKMCSVWLCDISCANCPARSNPQAYYKALVSSKYRRKLRKQDVLKRKALPKSWDTARYSKNISRHDLLKVKPNSKPEVNLKFLRTVTTVENAISNRS